jgi:hypothetical protein
MHSSNRLIGNWLVLGTLIAPLQGLGCLLLIATILILSRKPRPSGPTPAALPLPALQAEAGSAL